MKSRDSNETMRIFSRIPGNVIENTASLFETVGGARNVVEGLVKRFEGSKDWIGRFLASMRDDVGYGYDIGGAFVYTVLAEVDILFPLSLGVLPGFYAEQDISDRGLTSESREANKMADTMGVMGDHSTQFWQTLLRISKDLCHKTTQRISLEDIFRDPMYPEPDWRGEGPRSSRRIYVSHVINGGTLMYGLLRSQQTASLMEAYFEGKQLV